MYVCMCVCMHMYICGIIRVVLDIYYFMQGNVGRNGPFGIVSNSYFLAISFRLHSTGSSRGKNKRKSQISS